MTFPVPNQKQDRAQRTLFTASSALQTDGLDHADVVRETTEDATAPQGHTVSAVFSLELSQFLIIWGSSLGLQVCEHRLICFKLILAELAQTDVMPLSFPVIFLRYK